ncbi:spore germination protein [Virgibacillus phasianinus]|uniref:Spore germination protein n=2 Tax=Virgibacillus phasianinus TaxID=2017483 RepID=A0A220U8J5_9BACI|nr:spore germination protein [Virgibacillus phasianinus]
MKKYIYKDVDKLYKEQSSKDDIELKQQEIDPNLEKTVKIFKSIYSYPDNKDVKFRDLIIAGINKKATMLYINTITNTDVVEEQVISPLLLNQDSSKKINDIISIQSISTNQKIEDILSEVNKGNAALFVDGIDHAFIISASNFQGRGIEKAENEISLIGSKEAFNEKVMTNISLIRKKIKNENLVFESTTVSKRSKNDLFFVYVKDLVNDDLLRNVKDRVNAIDVDSVQNLAILEQIIEGKKFSIFPTILNTERPDRAATFLENGYIVLLMDNSPASLVLPATFWSFFHTAEDSYLRIFYGNFTRVLRMLAIFIAIFSSAIYVAVTTFHAEMVPPDLLLAIASTREKVPLPALIEVLVLELAFELIREAGLRVPSTIGPTIGIVGALILGQAAVQANIVSPIVVIVVALGGLSSFAVGNIGLNFAVRLSRFIFIFAAGLFGIYGITAAFVLGMFYMVSLKSFGVPYLSPMTPKYLSSGDTILRRMIKNELFRPGYLKPKDMKKKREN